MAMKCIAILAAGGGDDFSVHITRFVKIGCASGSTEAGFVCDYALGISSSSPMMGGEMGKLMRSGDLVKARFIHLSNDRWLFTPIDPRSSAE